MSCRLLTIGYSVLLLLTVSSCSNEKKEKKFQENNLPVQPLVVKENYSDYAGKIKNGLLCDADGSLNYCLYLPGNYTAEKKFPVLFIFDAHGDGSLPVKKYSSLAEEYGYILVASNNSKNGLQYDAIQRIASIMIQDAEAKLSIDMQKRYTLGFSGGSRVAGFVASHEKNFAGVIGCGAPFLDESMKSIPGFFCFGFAGNDDFNLIELTRSHETFNKAGLTNYLMVFEGKHEWPDSSIMLNAFEMLTISDTKKREAFSKKISTSTSNMMKQEKIFAEESLMQKKYLDGFASQNIVWWRNEITKLQQCGKTNKVNEEVHRCKRLLSYIGLAIYSYSNGAINNHQDADAQKFLEIYRMADESNSEQRFLEAVLKARQGNKTEAINLLSEAVRFGFSDFQRIENHPDLQNIKSFDGYAQIFSQSKTEQP
ncbi:MAG: hypothetical protein JJE25_02825 [Bacteroidia bacterium]|nr:hypothetical protein [Bacteroidia bacterium]